MPMRRVEPGQDPAAAGQHPAAASQHPADAGHHPAAGNELPHPEAAPAEGTVVPLRKLPGWLIVAIPGLAELIAGGYRIGSPSLWRDEAATISGSQRPVGEIIALVGNQDAVHGLYYLLMHVVIGIGGTSATALRLPSLIAMSIAAALTAALGRRLARPAAVPNPELVGLLAGLALAAVPLTTRYAQEARPYALTTMFAVLATYLLVRAAGTQRWPWWAGYSAALLLTGMFDIFAVLLAGAHGISLLAARPAGAAGTAGAGSAGTTTAVPDGAVAPGSVRRWLAACVAAAVLLAPTAAFSVSQSAQLSWVTTPDASSLAALVRDFAGATLLIPLAALLGWLGLIAGTGVRLRSGLTLTIVTVPWLVLPPVLLLAGSFAHPVYVERYVVFCLPALSLLLSAGLVWLCRLTAQAAGRRGLAGRRVLLVSVLPSVVLVIAALAALIGPQAAVRRSSSRPDNLRAVAAVVSAHERSGDAILYLPWDTELVGVAYPAPFSRLRDIGLGRSAIASATLRGVPAAPSVIASRMRGVARLWTVQWASPLPSQGVSAANRPEIAALGAMRLVHRWQIASVVLSLYQAR
jgi:mannosyltransferase